MADDQLTREDLLELLSDDTRRVLDENHFEPDTYLDLRRRYLAGELDVDTNEIDGEVAPPAEGDILEIPPRDSDVGRRAIEIGEEALDAGQVGLVVLNGGMATRFGGVVKGSVEVFNSLSFLGLKMLDARQWDDGADVLLMNSFATHDKTLEHLDEHDYFGLSAERVIPFTQNVSIRMTPEGEFFTEDGEVSLYAPGHGDLSEAVGRGALERFRARGGRYLLMSNVDNVLATLDPLVVGMHIDASRRRDVEMTVECVQRKPGQTGGMIARVDGDPQIVEWFRFPEDFDTDALPVFNTNTFMFDVDALDRDFDLTWFVVEKEVGGRTAIQFERLAGELTAYLNTAYVTAPAEGENSRFLPIKRWEDLEDNREFLERVVRARGLL